MHYIDFPHFPKIWILRRTSKDKSSSIITEHYIHITCRLEKQ